VGSVHPDEAVAPQLEVAREHADPVRVHAAEVGADHEAGGDLGGGGRHLRRDQDVHDEAPEMFVAHDDGRLGHGGRSPQSPVILMPEFLSL
jgi:hypothetical protein